MTIAIAGATGQLGRLVVDRLKRKMPSTELIALARNIDKAASLGVPARATDYTKPATLEPALAGVGTLLLISASDIGQRVAQHQNVIEAARKSGVRRIVYTSLLRADTSPINLAAEHRATEAMLKATGIPLTVLRNGWYTENYAGSIKGAVAAGAFIGSAGDGKISSAARIDYADAAVAALTSDSHVGKTYELAGDDAYTLSDLAAEISRQSGKTIPYKNMPEAQYAAALKSYGLPALLADAIASWDTCASKGALFEDGRQLSKLIGRPTTPLSAVVADALK